MDSATKNPIRVRGIQEDMGIKKIVNRMGSEDLCRETDRTGPKDTETLTVGQGELGEIKDKE
jgi:hypothetical protein